MRPSTTPLRRRGLLPALLVAVIAAPGAASAWVTYDAALGSLPQAQGWTFNEQLSPPMPYPLGVTGGALHFSTMGFANNDPVNEGAGVWWSRTDVTLDFDGEFEVEASVRIGSAPDHAVAGSFGWPRPGYSLSVGDVQGRVFWIGFGSNEVFLSNTVYGQYGSGNTVVTSFNTTDAQHVYRLERAPGGVGAALLIDGVQRLVLPSLGAVEQSGGLVYFGDGTFWSNSESYTAWVRYRGATVSVGAPEPSSVLWVAPTASPGRRASLSFRAEAQGRLSFELFDASGRRVDHAERDVAAGEHGVHEAAGARQNGLYFYRARLVPASGKVSRLSGRFVLVR